MSYLLLVRVGPDADPTPEESDPTAWVESVESAGQRLVGERLRPVEDATCVRVRDGRTIVTHGPFVEVVEQVGGFDVLAIDDLDEVVAVATRHPVATFGALELRELEAHEPVPGVDPGPGDGVPDATYLLLMGAEPGAPAPEPDEGGLPVDWIRRWGERDADRGGSPLRPPSEAVTVRGKDGAPVVTRGPFADLAEYVAGYNLLKVPDLDTAIQAAAEHPGARLGVIEIRPLWPF